MKVCLFALKARRASPLSNHSAPMAKSGPVNAWSFLTRGRELNILKYTTADQVGDTVLRSFTGEDGDAFCECLRWLGVEAPSEFQRIAAQSFAAFGNQFLELSQFVSECCVAVFLLQSLKKKIEIV